MSMEFRESQIKQFEKVNAAARLIFGSGAFERQWSATATAAQLAKAGHYADFLSITKLGLIEICDHDGRAKLIYDEGQTDLTWRVPDEQWDFANDSDFITHSAGANALPIFANMENSAGQKVQFNSVTLFNPPWNIDNPWQILWRSLAVAGSGIAEQRQIAHLAEPDISRKSFDLRDAVASFYRATFGATGGVLATVPHFGAWLPRLTMEKFKLLDVAQNLLANNTAVNIGVTQDDAWFRWTLADIQMARNMGINVIQFAGTHNTFSADPQKLREFYETFYNPRTIN